jgi:hypothetical protein
MLVFLIVTFLAVQIACGVMLAIQNRNNPSGKLSPQINEFNAGDL